MKITTLLNLYKFVSLKLECRSGMVFKLAISTQATSTTAPTLWLQHILLSWLFFIFTPVYLFHHPFDIRQSLIQ